MTTYNGEQFIIEVMEEKIIYYYTNQERLIEDGLMAQDYLLILRLKKYVHCYMKKLIH